MSCYYPILAYRQFKDSEGKWHIKMIPDRADYSIKRLRLKYGDDLLLLPCGKCLGCKFDKARDWATRVYCESLYHEKSCFLTLTYEDKFLPKNQKKNRQFVNEFIKSLRNRGEEIRYFGCGERGETTGRIHAHIILFGYMPSDLEFYSRGSNGDPLYTSKSLASLWSKGHILIGDVSYKSAGYVARYTTKKIGDDDSFLLCSNRPGIGYQYAIDHGKEIMDTGYVYGDFGDDYKAPIPRYFEKLLSHLYVEEWNQLLKSRLDRIKVLEDNAKIHFCYSDTELLKLHQAEVIDQKLSRIHRR